MNGDEKEQEVVNQNDGEVLKDDGEVVQDDNLRQFGENFGEVDPQENNNNEV